MENTPTFAERVERMRQAAEQLRQIGEIVAAEAAAMQQAAERFAAKKPRKGAPITK